MGSTLRRGQPIPSVEVIDRVNRARKPSSRLRKKTVCPHCTWSWRKKKASSKKCPHCRRDLNPESKVNVSRAVRRHKLPDLINDRRFTPSVIKRLVDSKLYRYLGIPAVMAKLTIGREMQRMANLRLADKFLLSDLGQAEFGVALKFDRAAMFFRLSKGIQTMAEYGRFQLTEKGRQKIAEQKIRSEINAIRGAQT
jgi:hypothetical protein